MSSSSSSPSSNPTSPLPADAPSDLSLTLRLATHPVHPSPSTHALTCSPDLSIQQLKQRLFEDWDGKPKVDGITIIKGGRVCRDIEILKKVFQDELSATPKTELVLHVVVRASAWSAPFTSPPPPPPVPPISTDSTALPSINTIPPSPLPSPPKDDATSVVDLPPVANESSSSGYSPSYVSPLPSTVPLPESSPATPTTATTLLAPPPGGNPYLIYLGHLQRLIPIQRSLLLLNLQKAHHYYQFQVQQRTNTYSAHLETAIKEEGIEVEEVEELKEVESLLKECGLWNLVQKREEVLESGYEYAEKEGRHPQRKEGEGEFKVVQLDGLHYLLHTPSSLHQRQQRSKPSLKALKSLARAETILKILTTMLQLLITFQPTSPAIAHGRALLSRPPTGLDGAGAGAARDDLAVLRAAGAIRPQQQQQQPGGPPFDPFAPPPPHHHHRAVRRAATISITLHLDSLLQFLLPLFFLSLKLAFLLFVFARHASPTKRYVLIGLAVGWVLWEGIRIARRRRVPGAGGPAAAGGGGGREGRDRGEGALERHRERERRRLVRDLAQQAQAEAQRPVHDQQVQVPQPAVPAQGRPPAPPAQQQPPIGGGVVAARPQQRSSSSSSSATRREPPSIFSPKYWINTVAAVGLVSEARELGLSPRYIAGRPISSAARPFVPYSQLTRWERQKLELRKLGRIIWIGSVLFVGTLLPEIERKRKKALEKRDRLLIEKKVRWEKEKEKEERDRERRGRSSRRSGQTVKKEKDDNVGRGSEEGKLEGRNKISDAELFKDGGSEAFASTSTLPATNGPTPSTSGSTAEAQPSISLPTSVAASTQPSQDSSPSMPTSDLDPDVTLTPGVDLEEEDEGDGDIAASASVSEDNSEDEGAAAGRAREAGAAGGDIQDGGDGAVVAIF